jgi:hypothetical protein
MQSKNAKLQKENAFDEAKLVLSDAFAGTGQMAINKYGPKTSRQTVKDSHPSPSIRPETFGVNYSRTPDASYIRDVKKYKQEH